MTNKYPEWATEKQLEGMRKLVSITNQYGNFDLEFLKENNHDEAVHSFRANVTWGWEGSKEGLRSHEVRIAWNYEKTWDRYGDEVIDWQFVFADGDATRELSIEVFILDLFFYLDRIAITKT